MAKLVSSNLKGQLAEVPGPPYICDASMLWARGSISFYQKTQTRLRKRSGFVIWRRMASHKERQPCQLL
jgi:hypothetical protein